MYKPSCVKTVLVSHIQSLQGLYFAVQTAIWISTNLSSLYTPEYGAEKVPLKRERFTIKSHSWQTFLYRLILQNFTVPLRRSVGEVKEGLTEYRQISHTPTTVDPVSFSIFPWLHPSYLLASFSKYIGEDGPRVLEKDELSQSDHLMVNILLIKLWNTVMEVELSSQPWAFHHSYLKHSLCLVHSPARQLQTKNSPLHY